MKPVIENLSKKHQKKDFNCGKELLDNYLHKQAGQDLKRNLAACFVAVDEENTVMGYYTLSSNVIERDTFPPEMASKLPQSYADLPAILLGRLAIDTRFQGRRLGEFLLVDALRRCVNLATQLGVLAVIVDPIDDAAVRFYEAYGFISLPDSGKMFITVKTIEDSF